MSSLIGNGGVLASFSSRISRAATSISPVFSFGLIASLSRASTRPMIADDELGAQALGLLLERRVADHDLRDAVAVAEVEEHDAAEIADAVDPAEQDDVLADVGGRQFAAGVGAGEVAERFNVHSMSEVRGPRSEVRGVESRSEVR